MKFVEIDQLIKQSSEEAKRRFEERAEARIEDLELDRKNMGTEKVKRRVGKQHKKWSVQFDGADQ